MKRVIIRIVAGALVAALAACQGANQGSNAPAATAAQPMVDASGLLPQGSEHAAKLLDVNGDYIHKPTGLAFPVRAGRLMRTNVATYDDAQDDVSASEGPMPDPRFKDAVVSRQAVYTADKSTIGPWAPLRTELYYQCGIGKVWVVQYRVTYARGFDAASVIRQLMAGVPK